MSLLKGLPVEHFRCILADPPWHFKANSAAKPGRNPRRHYDVMSLDEIAALPVKPVAADDCLLWLWITGPFLARGAHLSIFDAWGFEPSGMGFVWIKLNPSAPQMIFMPQDVAMGPGMTTRKNAEFCLLGRRGSVPRLSAAIHEVIIAPRREHSRKPDEAHERIEQYCDGPRLELFGRQQRPGWIVRGNEAEKFASEGQDGAAKEKLPLVQPNDAAKPRPAPRTIPDTGPPPDTGIVGRHRNGNGLLAMQQGEGKYDGGPVVGVPETASAMVARLRSRLRHMVVPSISQRDVE